MENAPKVHAKTSVAPFCAPAKAVLQSSVMATVTNKVLFIPRDTNCPRLAGGSLLPMAHSRIEPSVHPINANAPVLAMATDVGASSNETRWPWAVMRRRRAPSSCGVVAGPGAGGASLVAAGGVASLLAGSMAAVLVVRRSLAQRARIATAERLSVPVYAHLHRRAAAMALEYRLKRRRFVAF